MAVINRNRSIAIFLLTLTVLITFLYAGLEGQEYQKKTENLEGQGTEQNPYLIEDIRDLHSIRYTRASVFKIQNDINAQETAYWNSGQGFKPIGSSKGFKGKIYGNNKTIYGLKINRSEKNNVGLFSTINGAEIQNLEIVNTTVYGNKLTGTLTGKAKGDSSLSNITIESTVKGGNRTGGITGDLSGSSKIQDSRVASDVQGGRFTGGITGYSHHNNFINDSESYSTVKTEYFSVGGIVGRNRGEIYNVVSNSTVTGGSRVGGIAGDNIGDLVQTENPEIHNTFSGSQVSGERFKGVFVGMNGLDIENLDKIGQKNYSVIIENSEYLQSESVGGIGIDRAEETDLELR